MTPQPRIQLNQREWIKPKTPTPIDKSRLPLSDWDVVMFKSYTPMLLFYANTEKMEDFMNTEVLIDSLQVVLDDFYPLAGRLVDIGQGRDEIECNDAGVLFQETSYPEELESFKEDGYLPHQMDYHHMFPIHFYCSPQDPLLAIQVNRFLDGGVALGIMILHKIADTYSACLFLDAWAKQARGLPYAKACFKRSLVSFPPNTVITEEAIHHYREEHKVVDPDHYRLRMDPNQQIYSRTTPDGPLPLKSIVLEFHSDGLQMCKKDAHTIEMMESKTWMSTKEALFGMLLRAIVRSRNIPRDEAVRMILGVNGRMKMKYTKNIDYYFGNWMISRTITMDRRQVNSTHLAEAAMAFRRQLTSLRSSLFHGISKIYTMNEDMTVHYLTYQPNCDTQVTATDASSLPFWRLDFGFGRPDRTRGYITSGGNGCLVLFGRNDGNKGVMYDVQLQMDADSIKRFIDDPEVRKYSRRILY
ncbi:transferase [Halteromyces radiatus]|uniref:transferase n=1 Tax=Halteromyces radiatus TaxID=101107 RepID=UPI00221E75B0|nr:transferase [Halteromyces radiatus]KAI8099007.1 transferase [Halteromyces radiatus]